MLLSKKKSNNWAIFFKFCNTGKLNEKHWILFHNIDSKSNVFFVKKRKKENMFITITTSAYHTF